MSFPLLMHDPAEIWGLIWQLTLDMSVVKLWGGLGILGGEQGTCVIPVNRSKGCLPCASPSSLGWCSCMWHGAGLGAYFIFQPWPSGSLHLHLFLYTGVLEKPLEKKAGRNYGPPGTKKLIYFIDDMNMPAVDAYGTVQPHTLIRQHLDYGHW